MLSLVSAQEVPQKAGVRPEPSQSTTILLSQIKELEGKRDPKCYATASRLEDLIYGTPLTSGARFAKNKLEKKLISTVWRAASKSALAQNQNKVSEAAARESLAPFVKYHQLQSKDWSVTLKGKELIIKETDYRQYSTVAYALRAILSTQQDALLGNQKNLLRLSKEAVAVYKEAVDLYALAILQKADQNARDNDAYKIEGAELVRVWNEMSEPVPEVVVAQQTATSNVPADYDLIKKIIAQKVDSYEKYNSISSQVFLRNLQVYFARHGWPKDPKKGNEFRQLFTEAMTTFTHDLLKGAELTALKTHHLAIRPSDVDAYAQYFVPHHINEYEDATFFPNLTADKRVEIEAYDMDAFRDGGLHWLYLKYVIDDPKFSARLEPDPFAAELLTENVAQYGVLLLRVAGRLGKEQGHDQLEPEFIEAALRWIQERINEHAGTEAQKKVDVPLASAPDHGIKTRFADITGASGIHFQQRTSSWLARMIRSYTLKSESVGELTIPPAFQGSGVASEDLDGDGWPDVLILGGGGNRLYQGKGDGSFNDVTKNSGINWLRPDGHPGEPRQPILADFDNDGKTDIFISYTNDRHRIYRNLGDMRFEDMTEKAGLGGESLVGGPCTALDYDKDGQLDIYVGYFGDYIHGILPTLARRNTNGLPDKLFHNQGGFVFKDATEGSGIKNTGWTQAVGHTDFDGDGWQDIIAGNDFGVNVYYRNLGNGTFEDATEMMGTGKPSYTMGIGIADLNRDELPDIYISNIVVMNKDEKYVDPSEKTTMKFNPENLANMRVVEANDLFMSQSSDQKMTGYELSENVGRGYSSTGWSWFADFLDMDNDGDEDLYVVNGINPYNLYSSFNPYYADPDGVKREVIFPTETKGNVLFENIGGKLRNVSENSGVDYAGVSRSAAFADFDRDGDLDIVLNNLQEKAVVYQNTAADTNHWLGIRLVGDPAKQSTRDAIGAKIIVQTDGGMRDWREVHSTSGYLSAHPKEQHFGLGAGENAHVTVIWPNADREEFENVTVNTRYVLTQGQGDLFVEGSRKPFKIKD
jgi:hypothetical protein